MLAVVYRAIVVARAATQTGVWCISGPPPPWTPRLCRLSLLPSIFLDLVAGLEPDAPTTEALVGIKKPFGKMKILSRRG